MGVELVAVKATAMLVVAKGVAMVGEMVGGPAAEEILAAMAEKAAAAARSGSVPLPPCSRPPKRSGREQQCPPTARVPSRRWNLHADRRRR